jgi:hypothetical protein
MIKSVVCYGKQVARQIGFPTANIKSVYALGVYCGTLNGLNCIIYVSDGLVECHIPGWSGDLYNQEVEIEIKTFIRPDILFKCLDEVVTQIKKDLIIYNLINGIINVKGVSFVSFSGGKESCVLIDILHRLKIPFDVVHFQPSVDLEHLAFMKRFLDNYGLSLIIKDYLSFELAVKDYDHYNNCFLGVRQSDHSFTSSTWLDNCKIVTPLFDWSYSDVWNYIDNYNVNISEKYSQGYTSVGYNCKPNILLKCFDNPGYIHSKFLENFESERKK